MDETSTTRSFSVFSTSMRKFYVGRNKTKDLPDLPPGPLRLFLLVSVETKTLLTLVRSHLVPLMLFSVGHIL